MPRVERTATFNDIVTVDVSWIGGTFRLGYDVLAGETACVGSYAERPS